MNRKEQYTAASIAVLLSIAVAATTLYSASGVDKKVCVFSTCAVAADVKNLKTEMKYTGEALLDILNRQLQFLHGRLDDLEERAYKYRLNKQPIPPFITNKIGYYRRQITSIEGRIKTLQVRRG